MKFIFPFLISLVFSLARAQDYSAFHSTINSLYKVGSLLDTAGKESRLNEAWGALRMAQQIPLIAEDSVAFLYRGTAITVEWTGDFNAWGYNKNFVSKGSLVPGTDIWILKTTFPKDARMDYRIVINGNKQILDPENMKQQWSGVGGGSPNSELRMPDWKEDAALKVRPDIAHGTVNDELLFDSQLLGYQITYSVYRPANVPASIKLQSLYVTDGYEYMQPKLGNMITILDNLIADKKIKPIVVIFIDHREPINRSNNKRMDELAMNAKYLDFFILELIPFIEAHYPVQTNPASRGIMGSSLGGLTAAYFAFSKQGVFGMAGIQSPSFWVRPQIYSVCNSPDSPIKVSMTSGLISDASEASRKMKEILQSNACQYQYHEVNDGHSWGNWRNLIDDVLIDLFGN